MKIKKEIALIVALSFVAMIDVGCVTTQQKMTRSGFLSDYSGLEPGPKGGADFRYIKENVNFKAYDKIMMDHVVFFLNEDAKYKGVRPDELNELADAFHKAMAEALAGAYPMVEEPGPGVLRIRVAITDLVPNKQGLNAVTTVAPVAMLAVSPIGFAIKGTAAATGRTNVSVGSATIEAELLDSQTNERLAAVIDTRKGKKYDIAAGFHKWGDVLEDFKIWAKRLREWLDEVHGKKQSPF